MVNLCGRFMTDNFACKQVSLQAWKTAVDMNFFKDVGSAGAFRQFDRNARAYTKQFKARLSLLASAERLGVSNATEDLDELIANEGYGDLIPGAQGQVLTLKCELVRQYLLRHILRTHQITEPVPPAFNMVNILRVALSYFSPSHISEAFRISTKQATTTYPEGNSPFKAGDLVPKEAVYQVELFRILHSWASSTVDRVTISNEVDVRQLTKKSLDILYTENTGNKYAIELVASTTNSDLDVHANRRSRQFFFFLPLFFFLSFFML